MKRTIFVFLFTVVIYLLGGIMPAAAEGIRDKTIYITDDGDEWPPYTYYVRTGRNVTNELMGFSCDVIKEIFGKKKIDYRIELLPWKRAQEEVESGTKYSMFLSGSYNEERAKKYYISEPYYSTSAYYFYSKLMYPQGLSIKTKADLRKYKITGLSAHNYSDYGVDNNNVYMGSGDYESMVQQLHSGYYDIFLESLEIVAGWSAVNKNIINDKNLGYAKVPDMKPVNFYMMFTKNETGAELKEIVDEGIREILKSGRLKELLRKYIPE